MEQGFRSFLNRVQMKIKKSSMNKDKLESNQVILEYNKPATIPPSMSREQVAKKAKRTLNAIDGAILRHDLDFGYLPDSIAKRIVVNDKLKKYISGCLDRNEKKKIKGVKLPKTI